MMKIKSMMGSAYDLRISHSTKQDRIIHKGNTPPGNGAINRLMETLFKYICVALAERCSVNIFPSYEYKSKKIIKQRKCGWVLRMKIWFQACKSNDV